MSPGAWRRAGQTGMICGLDWPAVALLLPQGEMDRERVMALLGEFEAGMIEGVAEAQPKDKKG